MSVTVNHSIGNRIRAPISITLNDLERRNSPYFAFFSPNLTDFHADYITVVEVKTYNVRKLLSPSYSYYWLDYNASCSTVSLR